MGRAARGSEADPPDPGAADRVLGITDLGDGDDGRRRLGVSTRRGGMNH